MTSDGFAKTVDIRELIPGVYVIPGGTNVGVIRVQSGRGSDLYLIDSGGSEKDARKIEKILDAHFAGSRLRAIINTHSHADHTGGNAYFAEKTKCGIWMPYLEKGSVENTLLQPSLAWGGFPLPELRTPYYVTSQCEATCVIRAEEHIDFSDGKNIRCIALPGHYFEMLGILCALPDGTSVFFAGDAVFGKSVIAKFSIPFMLDVASFLDTLEKLRSVRADWYVPSHGEAVARIDETAEMNEIAVLQTITCIMKILKKRPHTAEDLLTEVANANGISMKLPQYVLIGSTLRSFLTYLYTKGRITYEIAENKMLWKTI